MLRSPSDRSGEVASCPDASIAISQSICLIQPAYLVRPYHVRVRQSDNDLTFPRNHCMWAPGERFGIEHPHIWNTSYPSDSVRQIAVTLTFSLLILSRHKPNHRARVAALSTQLANGSWDYMHSRRPIDLSGHFPTFWCVCALLVVIADLLTTGSCKDAPGD
jgi:hypothetical protein